MERVNLRAVWETTQHAHAWYAHHTTHTIPKIGHAISVVDTRDKGRLWRVAILNLLLLLGKGSSGVGTDLGPTGTLTVAGTLGTQRRCVKLLGLGLGLLSKDVLVMKEVVAVTIVFKGGIVAGGGGRGGTAEGGSGIAII